MEHKPEHAGLLAVKERLENLLVDVGEEDPGTVRLSVALFCAPAPGGGFRLRLGRVDLQRAEAGPVSDEIRKARVKAQKMREIIERRRETMQPDVLEEALEEIDRLEDLAKRGRNRPL